MYNEEYNTKIINHPSDQLTYIKIYYESNKNSVNKIKNDLKILIDDRLFSNKEYEYLCSNTASTPLFYALIKTHKQNNPIRLIV